MTASEVWFLRAEAALRGWTDEDEENCYRNGVMTSFEQWGVYGVEDYLKSERIASNFVDTYETENNVEARCKVSPKWNPSDDKEKKLEKIITQKWIAMFPFPGTLQTEDPEQYSALVKALDGEDHEGTYLWWDTGNNSLE